MKRLLVLFFYFAIFSILVFPQARRQLSYAQEVKKIDRLIQAYVDAKLFNGSVLVAQKGRVIFKKGFGLANMEWNIPNSPNTKFRIGSVTKQFTAMLIMQLKQERKLNLQATISDYLPWFRKDIGNRITIHHLLSHTSGLPNYTGSSNLADIQRGKFSHKEVAEKYCSGNPEFEPGSRFQYSNSGYFLLGLIVEAIAKKPFATVLKEKIFDPVGMKNSGIDSPSALITNRAAGYEYSFDGYVNTDHIDMESSIFAAGAIYSTVADLFLWQQALFGNKLLSNENTDLMLKPNLGGYGYGFYINRSKGKGTEKETTVIGHAGGINGFSALSLHFVEDDAALILLDNTHAAKRENPENIGVDIVAILNGLTPRKPQQSLRVAMTEGMLKGHTGDELVTLHRRLKSTQTQTNIIGGTDSLLNDLGYFLLEKGRVKDSLSVLKLAVEEYPASSNAFDSYAEALAKDGQIELAIKNYKRALELDPRNTNARKQIKELESQP